MEKLAAHLYSRNPQDFHSETFLAAKRVLLDTLGAMIAGMQQEETLKLAKSMVREETGSCRIIGTSLRTSMEQAALLHGTAAVATEMDEGNQWSKGHPAAHVVPVMLTLLQYNPELTGVQFMTILIKAYEACSRFGRAATLLPEAHAHGTWGIMGASAAALLMDDTIMEKDFAAGVNLSASFALPTLWSAALDGKLVRNLYTGHAVEMGIKTVGFLKSGYYAPEQNARHVFSKAIGTDWDSGQLTRKDDIPWDIELNYFKPFAFCRYAHAPIEALKKMMSQHQLNPLSIQSVKVFTYARASTLSKQEYPNILSAKFSIPYALAVWAYTQQAGHDVFSDEMMKDSGIRDFAKKVEVFHSAELDREYPKIMPAIVEVADNEGRIFSERVDIAEGGPGKIMSDSQLIDKFLRLTDGVLTRQRQHEVVERVMKMEEQQSAGALIELCCL